MVWACCPAPCRLERALRPHRARHGRPRRGHIVGPALNASAGALAAGLPASAVRSSRAITDLGVCAIEPLVQHLLSTSKASSSHECDMRTISTVDDRAPPSLEPSDGPLVDGPPLHVPAGSMAPISDFYAAGAFVPTLPHAPTPSQSRECGLRTLSTLDDRAQAGAQVLRWRSRGTTARGRNRFCVVACVHDEPHVRLRTPRARCADSQRLRAFRRLQRKRGGRKGSRSTPSALGLRAGWRLG